MNNVISLQGAWKAGWAIALHTISSTMRSDGSFENEYTRLGWALNQFKYHNDRSQLDYLAGAMIHLLKTRMVTPYIHTIIPTPASKQREYQPVYELARIVGGG